MGRGIQRKTIELSYASLHFYYVYWGFWHYQSAKPVSYTHLDVYKRQVRSFIRELCDARGKTILISSHILSEISLLADDIGIIDHGALLEEESLAELEQKSSKHIRFTLSDTAQAARILERNFHENHFSIQDDHSPVSYTHLDVYKRQVRSFGKTLLICKRENVTVTL